MTYLGVIFSIIINLTIYFLLDLQKRSHCISFLKGLDIQYEVWGATFKFKEIEQTELHTISQAP